MQPSTLDMSGAPQGVQPQSGAPPGAQASPMYGGYAMPPPGAQWDPRGQQYVYMPQGVIPWSTVNAPAMATAQGAAPTVETIKDVTKGELEALSTELGPSERERWSKKFLLRAKLSVPGVHAVLTMTSEEYASLRAGDEQAIARLRQKYGAFDFLASDEVGARMLYSVIDPKGEHSEAFLHDLEKEPDEVQGSGRQIYERIKSIEENDLTGGDDMLKDWGDTDWLARAKCTSLMAVKKALRDSIAAYKRIPAKLRQIDVSEGGLQVVLKVLESLPPAIKGDSGKPLGDHYRTMMLKKSGKGKLMIGANCEWADIDAFIRDVAIDLKAAKWFECDAAGPREANAFEEQKKQLCLICGRAGCRGIKALKFCPNVCKDCDSPFCEGAREDGVCDVHGKQARPTAATTRNGRGWPLPAHGLAELQSLYDAKDKGGAGKLVAKNGKKEISAAEVDASPRGADEDDKDWSQFM
jgi:hypothetical protein